jgi:hypothetical protein
MTGNVESGPVHPRFAVPKPQLASGTRPPTRVGVLWTTTVGSVATSSGQWPSYRTAGEWESLWALRDQKLPLAHAPTGGLEPRVKLVCLLSVFAALRSHRWQGAGDGGKEVAAETVGRPGPTRLIRVSGIDASESEPAAQPGQSAIQIPPHHFDGSGPYSAFGR